LVLQTQKERRWGSNARLRCKKKFGLPKAREGSYLEWEFGLTPRGGLLVLEPAMRMDMSAKEMGWYV
jgi:hypothetical protein